MQFSKKFLTESCENRQEVFQKHGSTSLRAVELLPLYGDQILQFWQRTKGILINKLSLEYIYSFPIMWNYERDINHKSYMKNIVEAQIPASILQSEGLRETNMMQGGFNYVKIPLWKFFFFLCATECVCRAEQNLCYSKWLWSGEPQNADSSI